MFKSMPIQLVQEDSEDLIQLINPEQESDLKPEDVPEELSIIGFNDLAFCKASVPPLSSVSTERQEAGTWAGNAIIEIIRGSGKRPKSQIVDMGFNVQHRASSGPLKPRPATRRNRAKAA